jgi:Tol biopolymer transport system component
VFSPVWSPDGDEIAFIGVSEPGQPDIYLINSDGTGLRPVQVTVRSHEFGLDWR